MNLSPFKLERYFAKYEFVAPYLLSCSDCEPLTLKELLSFADKALLKKWENLWLGYTDSKGSPDLRQAIADCYQQVNPDNVLVAVPQEAIYLLMNTLLKKGDHVIAPFPGYQSLYENARSIGCDITYWKPDSQNWKFDINDVKSAIKSNTKLIVINFPHNPTGAMLSKKDQAALVELARKHDIYIFSDEMYFGLDLRKDEKMESIVDLYEKRITLFGLSKTFGLPGLRIGWLVTRDKKVLEDAAAFKDYLTICPSAPSEALALIALKAKDQIIKRNLAIIRYNLSVLTTFVEKHSDKLTLVEPEGSSVAFVEYKGDVDALAQRAIDQEGVMVLPASAFDYEGSFFRVGLGRKNMPEVLERLEKVLMSS